MSEWTDMPEPKAFQVLDWEDVYDAARDETEKRFGRKPTRQEVIDIFNGIASPVSKVAYELSTFWEIVEKHAGKYFSNQKSALLAEPERECDRCGRMTASDKLRVVMLDAICPNCAQDAKNLGQF